MLRSQALTFNHMTGYKNTLRDTRQKKKTTQKNLQDMEGNECLKILLENNVRVKWFANNNAKLIFKVTVVVKHSQRGHSLAYR